MRIAVVVAFSFWLISCSDSGSNARKSPPQENCISCEGSFKPLPESEFQAASGMIKEYAAFTNGLVPKTAGPVRNYLMDSALSRIHDNCFFKKSGSKSRAIVQEKVEALPRLKRTCPILYAQERMLNVDIEKRVVQGKTSTKMQVLDRATLPNMILESFDLSGNYNFRRIDKGEFETVIVEHTQEGSGTWRNQSKTKIILLLNEEKRIRTQENGEKQIYVIQSERVLITELFGRNIVFAWSLQFDDNTEQGKIVCTLNGRDLSDSELCQKIY